LATGIFQLVRTVISGVYCHMLTHALIRSSILSLTVVFMLFPMIASGGQTWDEMVILPEDAVQVQNLRVWLAQEQAESCSLRVEILDSTGTPVCLLLDREIRPGYFNLYWDRRDDSGKFVSPGQYTYRVNDCGGNRTGRLTAEYKKYELTSVLHVDKLGDSSLIEIELGEDSVPVRLEIRDRRNERLLAVLPDTVMAAGIHRIEVRPIKAPARSSVKYVVLHIGEAVILKEVTLE